jgi:alginate O-acetyltransferase complex protein AlgI
MLFNSAQFLVFFTVVTTLYFLVPYRVRWALLLIASCYFYMVFKPVYILILAFTIAVDYIAGIAIENAPQPRRKLYLLASIFANVGVLMMFKYYNFVNQALQDLFHTAGMPYSVPFLRMLLPIGLSFHVFQSLSYTIEVYRKHTPAERHLGIFALYVMFYPQLVAGPIERPQNLLHQFHAEHHFDYNRVVAGLQLMIFGFFKKVVIADRLAPFVNQVYDDPTSYHGISFIVATVFFAFQIYCDFSGYSDIALGSAQVMGFTLMKNFNRPYLSKSVAEFWKRWHISLSSWFRDYVYISLGGSRVSTPRWLLNLMITFVLSGLWHGANWTYIIWGALNGLYLIGEIMASRYLGPFAPRVAESSFWFWPVQALRVVYTFTLICFAWIFFRASSVSVAFYIVRHMFDGMTTILSDIRHASFIKMNILMRQDKQDFLIALGCIALLLTIHLIQRGRSIRAMLADQPGWLRWSLYYASIISILFFGAFNSAQQFIYFQF